jgi:phosphoribosylaminoimidazolecarboxamide formyltransferase/IMP cyclohydrolase
VVAFAQGLVELGYTLLSTSGTLKALRDAGLPVIAVEEYTGQAEILDGRVKTLHPKIHAGILARYQDPAHRAELEREDILPISIVVVNLYPFLQTLAEARESGGDTSVSRMVDKIDIGGPTMIRGAAKNHHSVIPVIDPADYDMVLEHLRSGGVSEATRRVLASKVFAQMAAYDLAIGSYLAEPAPGESRCATESNIAGFVGVKSQALRYGENPHQRAALYTSVHGSIAPWRQLHGKELSYNNLLDVDAAISLLNTMGTELPVVAILKHLNPCGVAHGETLLDALKRAKACDPRSHFGGILCFSQQVTEDVVMNVQEDFAEIIVAPSFSAGALEQLSKRKALRIIETAPDWVPTVEFRSAAGALLVQEPDYLPLSVDENCRVSERAATAAEYKELVFAWQVCRHVKSNAIVVVNNGMTVGIGAGQMSRIDSVEVALAKAARHGHDLAGAGAASDAFFPFPDGAETLIASGVRAIVVPGGAKRDPEVVEVCNKNNVALYFLADRHFRH